MLRGVLYGLAAHTVWGLFPLYFRYLGAIPALEVLGWRICCTGLFVGALLLLRRQWAWLGPTLRNPRLMLTFTASALLIGTNWFMLIWATTHGRVVEAALAYFINPLISVFLGWLVLKEPVSRPQALALLLVAIGVAWIGWAMGSPPWLALGMALPFGTYSLIRKTAPLGALEGLTLETLLLAPLALLGLGWAASQGAAAFPAAPTWLQWMVLGTGPATAVPLLLFTASTRLVSMSLTGLLQYLGPTLQLFVGVWVLKEPFDTTRALGFLLIWIGCALFTADMLWRSRRASTTGAGTSPVAGA